MPDPTLREQLRALGCRGQIVEDLQTGLTTLSYRRVYPCCGAESDSRYFYLTGPSREKVLEEALAHEQAMDVEEAGRERPCCGERQP